MTKMDKKGVQLTLETFITFGLLIILGITLLYLFRPTASEAGRLFSSETLKAKDAKCKFDGQRALDEGKKFADVDKDGRPDTCDICLSCSGGNSNNDIDSDLDGMPDYCDQAPNDPTIVVCKKGMKVTKDGRCIDTSCPYQ